MKKIHRHRLYDSQLSFMSNFRIAIVAHLQEFIPTEVIERRLAKINYETVIDCSYQLLVTHLVGQRLSLLSKLATQQRK